MEKRQIVHDLTLRLIDYRQRNAKKEDVILTPERMVSEYSLLFGKIDLELNKRGFQVQDLTTENDNEDY